MGIVEAMAAGLPVVAWRNGGPTVTVKDRETGFLVEPYDTDDFAHRLLQLATSPDLAERMGRAGHRRARELFSYEQHNAKLERALLDAAHRAILHYALPDVSDPAIASSEPISILASEEMETSG